MSSRPVTDLLSRASTRTTVQPADGKSSSTFEKVVVDGERYFLKRLSPASDWIMRVTGDRYHRPYLIWQSGLMDQAPRSIDHTVVAMEVAGDGPDAELSMLMRDISAGLVPEGDAVVPIEQHANFIDHLAQLAATFWGFTDSTGKLTTMAERLHFFHPDQVARELAVDQPPGPIAAADLGWRQLPDRSALLAAVARAGHDRPELVTEPLASTPVTFLHGDWKMGNLGSHPDGRTILLDWAYPGSGAACWELCWYLALNAARLPESKEATIERHRAALSRHGVPTQDWYDVQLDLSVIAIMVTFGWEKALGGEAELRWWEQRVSEAIARQNLDLPAPMR
jgi:hypothetical protein